MSDYGYNNPVVERIRKIEAQQALARIAQEQLDRERNRVAWLRFCGAMSPIGKLEE